MDTSFLDDFLVLARELNFSRAAEMRHMTQPAFSRRIKCLEELIATPLIVRTTRHVELTPAGKAFKPKAEAICRLLAEAKASALEAADQAQRHLNLAATHALSYTFVPRWLMLVASDAEISTTNLVSDTHRQGIRLLRENKTNFFIGYKSPHISQDLAQKDFTSCVIGTDCLLPLSAPDPNGDPMWVLETGSSEVPSLAYSEASALQAILDEHWKLTGRPNILPTLNSVLATTNLAMAKEGHGLAYLPLSLAVDDIESGKLVRAGSEAHDIAIDIVLYRPRTRMSPHHEAFWSAARETANE